MTEVDDKLMARAIEIAQQGDPSPNPPVGSVVADGETIVAEGCHQAAGMDHAEIAALKEAGGSAEGKTLYVTVEPCNHEGRTPPCVDEIIKAKLKRVVVGTRDPNPNVAGGGIEKLESVSLEFEGVTKAYAIQAGRELRVLVENDNVDDARADMLANDIAEKIQGEMQYPGHIKVTVIREHRAVGIAK